MSATLSMNTKKQYVHAAIVILITFGFRFIPPIGDITPLGMQVFGVFCGMLYGWIFCGLLWPSIFGILALGLTDYTTVSGAFAAGIGHQNTLIVLVALLFGFYLDKAGLSHTIANKFISAKICVGRPWIFITMYFLACYLIGAVVNLFAGIILMTTIYYQIASIINEERQSSLSAFMLIGICFITVLGGYSLPIKEGALFMRSIMEPTLGQTVPFIPWVIWFNVMHLMASAVYIFLGKFIFHIDTSKLEVAGDFLSERRVKGIPAEQILPMILLVIFVVVLIIPSFMPTTLEITKILSNMGLIGTGSALIIFTLIARDKNGEPLSNFDEMMSKGINWSLVMLIAATMPIGAAMESDATGIVAWLTSLLIPISQAVSPTVLIIIVTILFCAITQIAHNMVLMIVMIPLLESLAIQLGSNPIALALMFNYGVTLAIMTPGASAQAAMFHGNTEWITSKQAYGYSAVTVLFQLIIGLIIGIPLVHVLFPWG